MQFIGWHLSTAFENIMFLLVCKQQMYQIELKFCKNMQVKQ